MKRKWVQFSPGLDEASVLRARMKPLSKQLSRKEGSLGSQAGIQGWLLTAKAFARQPGGGNL